MQRIGIFCRSFQFFVFLFVGVALLQNGCYKTSVPRPEVAAVPVRTATVEKSDVQLFAIITGKTESDPVNVVPRIRGYLEEICFYSGSIVEKDTVLFKIEQFDYLNDLDMAKAKLSIAVAEADRAKADYERNLALQEQGKGFTTQSDIDRTKALWEEAKGKINSAKASVSEAEKELERTVIRAPFRGKMSRNFVEKGNLVDGTTGNPPVLATLMNMDPMYVYFQITDASFNQLVHQMREELRDVYKANPHYKSLTPFEVAEREKLTQTVSIELQLSGTKDPNNFPYKGIIDYVDNEIDISTGTCTLRGRFNNPNFEIFSGNICRVRLKRHVEKGAITVLEKAICYDLSDKYVWLVGKDQTAEKRTIELGEALPDGRRLVTSGLKGGETYVLDGVQKVRAKVPVTSIAEESSVKKEPEKSSTPEPAKEPSAPEKP